MSDQSADKLGGKNIQGIKSHDLNRKKNCIIIWKTVKNVIILIETKKKFSRKEFSSKFCQNIWEIR